MTTNQYDNMWPGPLDKTGRQTYFTRDVPKGWEWRRGVDEGWRPFDRPISQRWCQVREPLLPDPKPVQFQTRSSDISIVTTWGEMVDRGDLPSWEYMRANGVWASFDLDWGGHSTWPLRVRRKSCS